MPRDVGESQQNDWVMPPMFTAAGGTSTGGQTWPATGPLVIQLTTTQTIIDLTSICGTGAKAAVPQGNDDWNPNPVGHYIMLQVEGDNAYFAFGDSPASLGTLAPTYVTAVDGGTITGATGKVASTFSQTGSTASGCAKLIKDSAFPLKFKLPVGRAPVGSPPDNSDVGRYSPARYLAVVAGATSSGVYLRLWQVSP